MMTTIRVSSETQVADREAPRDDERGFLSFHFAGMNVGEHQHARLPAASRRRGIRDRRRRQDRQRQRASFLGPAERGHRDVRARVGQRR